MDNFQSMHRRYKSTETALLKIQFTDMYWTYQRTEIAILKVLCT